MSRSRLKMGWVALWICLAITPTPIAGLEVELVPSGPVSTTDSPEHPLHGSISLTPSGGAHLEGLEARSVMLTGGHHVSLDLPADTWWLVEADIDDWWAEPAILSSQATGFRLHLHPAGYAHVELATEAELAAERLTANFTSSLEGRRVVAGQPSEAATEAKLSGTSDCSQLPPEDNPNRWRCKLPAGSPLDVQLHSPGYASVFRWDVTVPHRGIHVLGTANLKAGGSVIGWIDAPLEARDLAVTVTLRPETAGVPGARTERLDRTTVVGRGGLFQFDDLAAGSYEIELAAPGWAPTRRGSVEVLPGRETELQRPLELRRPSKLTLCVSPAVIPGFRLPEDTWEFYLYPPDGEFRRPVNGRTGEDGCWMGEAVQPGGYRLVIRDSRGSRWAEEILEVSGEKLHTVDLDLLELGGTVRQGGEPRRARLHFKRDVFLKEGRPGEVEIIVFTDLEGRIAGALPEEGVWSVRALLQRDGALNDLGRHEILRPADGKATLHLEIPDGQIAGRVVTAAGREVAHARVAARPVGVEDAGTSKTETDSEGAFGFEALFPHDYEISVLSEDGSAEVQVTVQGDGVPEEVEIVLTEARRLTGRVVGDHGPVPGAQVLVHGQVNSYRPVPVQRVTTDESGSFSTTIPADSEAVTVMVLPPGYSSAVLHLPPPTGDDGPLLLSVSRLGGTLVLRSETINLLVNGGSLFVDGREIWLPLLENWAEMGGGSAGADAWVIPNMGAGDYRWCLQRMACESGYLSPLGRLELVGADMETSASGSPSYPGGH